MLDIVAHAQRAYPPRTYENAGCAQLTIALALDYETAGERLTRRAAGDRYLALPLTDAPLTSARRLWWTLTDLGLDPTAGRPVLNIAGNGIYSLAKAGWTQAALNAHLHAILTPVHQHIGLSLVVSGGQTGIDLAGGIAAHALGIPVRMTLPAGFLQRGVDHRDIERTEAEIRAEVIAAADVLSRVAVPT
ncbi:hypothetical protein ACOI1H_19170 [Loktanella sp. DJP18]|uniref:hypothetical protein n=1 Tax=Loktanella sp. DJP18 TaxID=3409788 RepID=UPI003BB71B71